MKKMASLFVLALFCVNANAQQEPGATPPPEADIQTTPTIVDDKNARTLMDNFLNAKGWIEGENKKKGGNFFLAAGVGVIQAPRGDRNYIASRVAAYNKAMLDAKKQMAEYLSITIQTETVKAYSEGRFDSPESVDNAGESSMLAKIKQLVHAKLDDALRAKGIDPDKGDKKEIEKALAKELNSESYRKMISTAASAYVQGMQVHTSFEYTPANKKGEIGVITIWSDKLQRMAESMTTGAKPPAGMPKKPLGEQIPSDPAVLLTTFGVQQKLDEDGNLVLVAFGQEGALTDSPASANAANSKAQMNAQAAIREFAGESVAVATDMLNAETTKEYEDNTASYENANAFSERIQAQAGAMNISGISTLKRWKAKHPVNGGMVYGVVCTWSPQSAARAGQLKKQMETGAKPGASAGQQKEARLQGNAFEGVGQSADDDAF